jgi:hypothetical protein
MPDKRSTLVEHRGLPLTAAHLQIRADGDDTAERFIGHAAKFNSRTAIGNPLTWGFYEEVAPGAFTKSLSEGDQRFLIDHDTFYVVSRVSAGSLSLAQDKEGLAVDSALDDELSYVRDLKANLRNGNITGMSFGFRVVKDKWERVEVAVMEDGTSIQADLRTLLELELVEVSAVTFPAYADTDAGLRTIAPSEELAAVGAALVRRGDLSALELRCEHQPDLNDFRQALLDREPEQSTRDDDTEPAAPTPYDAEDLARRTTALKARFSKIDQTS